MVATNGGILDEIFNPTLSARDACKILDDYYEKLKAKAKGSTLTAADAKKEGPTIIKLVNSCLKQVCNPKFLVQKSKSNKLEG